MAVAQVTYENGEVAEAKLKPVHGIGAERKYGTEKVGTLEATAYTTWLALKKPSGNFEGWLEMVDKIELVPDPKPEGEEADDGPLPDTGSPGE